MSKVEGSFVGKHDLQLEREMNQVLKDAGLDADTSFERKRGRVTLAVRTEDKIQAIALLVERHPELVYRHSNPSQGDREYLIFFQQ